MKQLLKKQRGIYGRHNLSIGIKKVIQNSFLHIENDTDKKSTTGITLIALVITIIVLLIIAGISIIMLTGENGMITQTQKSKIAYELVEIKEQVELGMVEELQREIIRYMNVEEAEEFLTNMSERYKNKIGLYRENVVYLGNENSEEGRTIPIMNNLIG